MKLPRNVMQKWSTCFGRIEPGASIWGEGIRVEYPKTFGNDHGPDHAIVYGNNVTKCYNEKNIKYGRVVTKDRREWPGLANGP